MIPGTKFCPACGAASEPAPGLPGYLPVSEQLPRDARPATGTPKTTNGLAIASMVLGIVWIYWIGSILALIFGYVAKGQIAEENQVSRTSSSWTQPSPSGASSPA